MKVPRPAIRELQLILRTNPTVVGFSETLKQRLVRGKPTGSEVIRVYVEKKRPKSKLQRNQVLPSRIHGIRVDVVEMEKSKHRNLPTAENFARCSVGYRG